MRLVLDTSFLLELRRGNEAAKEALRKYASEASDVVISVLTQYELLVGAYRRWREDDDHSELTWLSEVLKWVTVVPVTEGAVDRAAKLRNRLGSRELRGSISDFDLLIACAVPPPARLLTCDWNQRRLGKLLRDLGLEVTYVAPERGRTR